MRQDYREHIPEQLAARFSRKIKTDEWTEMHKGIAQTDLLALGQDDAKAVLSDPSKADQMIKETEREIRALAGKKAPDYYRKSRTLAAWMVRGEGQSNNIQRNAYAIAKLAGEKDVVKDPSEELVEQIDRLVSLYAFTSLDPDMQGRLQQLMESETDGMSFVVGYLFSTRGMEIQRLKSAADPKIARINGWKGYVPSVLREGEQLLIADDADNARLERKGYVRQS